MRGNERKDYCKLVTPIWTNKQELSAIYEVARYLTKSTKVNYNVDHIVPLIHPYVCGLHCLDNLDILKATLNLHKSNNYWPDMWDSNFDLELNDTLPYQLSLF